MLFLFLFVKTNFETTSHKNISSLKIGPQHCIDIDDQLWQEDEPSNFPKVPKKDAKTVPIYNEENTGIVYLLFILEKVYRFKHHILFLLF